MKTDFTYTTVNVAVAECIIAYVNKFVFALLPGSTLANIIKLGNNHVITLETSVPTLQEQAHSREANGRIALVSPAALPV